MKTTGIRLRLLIAWLVLIVSSLVGKGQGFTSDVRDLTLAERGKATAVIVIGKAASPTEQYAARELKDYLKKISGAEVAIKKEGEPAAETTKILIGTSDSNGEVANLKDVLHLEDRKLGRDGLLVKTTEGKLVLAGRKAPGALYATYAFLEDHLGVRWFFPGTAGEYVPRMQTIKIGAIEDVQKPSLQYRGTNPVFELNDKDTDTWLGRNRMNFRRSDTDPAWISEMKERGLMNSMLGEETFNFWLPPKETFKAHPEYFSLVQKRGKRERKSQPCLSNPGVLAEMKKNILNDLAKNPDTDVLMIGQYDWDLWCQCENCLAMDSPEDRKINANLGKTSATALWNARASTRFHKFLNQLLPEIQKSYPTMLFATYAYLQTMRPPMGVEPYKGMIILHCMNDRCARHTFEDDCPLMERAKNGTPKDNAPFGNGITKWEKFGNPIILYSYIGDFAMGSPQPTAYLMADEIRFVKKQGYVGWLTEWKTPSSGGTDSWYARKLDNYIAAKLLWKTDADLEKLREDFFQKFYGRAAEPMKKQYEAFEKAWLSRTEDQTFFGNGKKHYSFLNDAVLKESRTYFAQANELAAKDTLIIQERVNRDQTLFDRLSSGPKPPQQTQ